MRESKFDGGLLGLIGINLCGVLLTLFTLGIGAPFAIVIAERWKARHTVINGRRLHFDGSAMQLMGNWIKWIFFCIITLGIYSFWLGLSLRKWIIKHTHFYDEVNESL